MADSMIGLAATQYGEVNEQVDPGFQQITGPQKVYSVWPLATTSKKEKSKIIMVMRSAERIDRVFGKNWMKSEISMGRYLRTDMNIPHHVQSIPLQWTHLNSPITVLGKTTSQLLARSMHNVGLRPQVILCSPMLRSIETASAIASFLGISFSIEPGLIEPLAWFRAGGVPLPSYDLHSLRSIYPMLSTQYSSMCSMEKLHLLYPQEDEKSGIHRIEFALHALGSANRTGPLLLVGHAITCEIAEKLSSSQAGLQMQSHMGEVPRVSPNATSGTRTPYETMNLNIEDYTIERFIEMGCKYPPASIVMMTQLDSSQPMSYKLQKACMSMSSGYYSSQIATNQ